jgi:hypothetical protein
LRLTLAQCNAEHRPLMSSSRGYSPTSAPPARRVQRTMSCRDGTQIIGQRVQVGLRYASQIVTIEVDETTLRVYDHRDHLSKNDSRTSRTEVT